MSPMVTAAATAAVQSSSSALFVRTELAHMEEAGSEHAMPVVQWTSLPTEPPVRTVARLATWAPGSDAESGLIELGPWPGGLAANGPRAVFSLGLALASSEASSASRMRAASSGSMAGRSGMLGMDPIGLALLVIAFVVLTAVAALLAHVAIG